MIRRLRPRSLYDVLATLAFFGVLAAGTAYAANTVFSSDIVDGEVKTNDLAANAVGSGKIADQQVKNVDLGLGVSSSNTIADAGVQGIDVKDNTLKGADIDESTLSNIGGGGPAGGDLFGTYPNPTIKANAVNSAKVANESLTLDDITDESLTGHDIQDNTIGGADVNESLLDYGVSTASFASHTPSSPVLIGNAFFGDTQVLTLLDHTNGTSGGLLDVPADARVIVNASIFVEHSTSGAAPDRQVTCGVNIAEVGQPYTRISRSVTTTLPNHDIRIVALTAGTDVDAGTYNVQVACSASFADPPNVSFYGGDLTATAISR